MRKLLLLLALGALATFGLAACGGGSDSSSSSTASTSTSTAATGGGGGTVDVAADPGGQLAFQESTLSAKAGSDTFDFTNDSSTTHDFCIDSSSGDQLGCTDQISGSSATLTVDLQPGKYTYYCSVPGHRDAGMEGTLTVK